MTSKPPSSSGDPPLTRPLNEPPAVWGGRGSRDAPFYGLGLRISHKKVLAKYNTSMDLSSLASQILVRRWYSPEVENEFRDKIQFSPKFIPDWKLVKAREEDDLVCFVTFNKDTRTMDTLRGPEGPEVMKTIKKVMEFTEEEQSSLMWYKCAVAHWHVIANPYKDPRPTLKSSPYQRSGGPAFRKAASNTRLKRSTTALGRPWIPQRTTLDWDALIPFEILALEWHSQEAGERFQDKIIFDPRFIPDFKSRCLMRG
ncbi:hypothetical protein DFH06DRAFT_1477122 [Mycena polygramma]|nr:hypothetical protein DFH06DRAFT_1477122 [Mycena polygramma]